MSSSSTSTSTSTNTNGSGNSNIPEERNQESTVFVSELAPEVTEDLLWELMLQAGPVVSVHIPRDRATNGHSGFGFAEFAAPKDADYAARVMNGVPLFGRPIRAVKSKFGRSLGSGAVLNVGANLFLGNLDPGVDERMLLDTFSAFGEIIANPKVARDPESGKTKGYGFVQFDSFEASDAAIEAMNGQFLCNRPITVAYAFKNDGSGERHGTQAERQLAKKMKGSKGKALTAAEAAAATAASLANIIPADIPSTAFSSVYGITQQQQQQQPPIQSQPPPPPPPPPQQIQPQPQFPFQPPSQFQGMPQLPPPSFPMPMQPMQNHMQNPMQPMQPMQNPMQPMQPMQLPQQNLMQPMYPPGFITY